MAFKAKDLHYEKQEPAFLRKLRGHYGAGDRHDVSVARPSKPRLELGEDDGPTIVDENGTSITKEEYETLAQGKSSEDTEPSSKQENLGESSVGGSETHLDQISDQSQRGKVATIGASNKRKQARIIADENEEDRLARTDKDDKILEKSAPVTKAKGKKKKIKLSFDEDGN